MPHDGAIHHFQTHADVPASSKSYQISAPTSRTVPEASGLSFHPRDCFFCNNLINESHTRKLVIDIHSYMQLFIQGNELFIYGFVHTRKWLVHARTWVIHIQGNELFIYKEMSYSYKEMNYSYMELFIQGNELFIYLYRTTYATYVCMHCVCIYVW